MVALVSPAALVISTTTPNGPVTMPDFILEMAFFTISIVIGMGVLFSGGSLDMCSGSHSKTTLRSLF